MAVNEAESVPLLLSNASAASLASLARRLPSFMSSTYGTVHASVITPKRNIYHPSTFTQYLLSIYTVRQKKGINFLLCAPF